MLSSRFLTILVLPMEDFGVDFGLEIVILEL